MVAGILPNLPPPHRPTRAANTAAQTYAAVADTGHVEHVGDGPAKLDAECSNPAEREINRETSRATDARGSVTRERQREEPAVCRSNLAAASVGSAPPPCSGLPSSVLLRRRPRLRHRQRRSPRSRNPRTHCSHSPPWRCQRPARLFLLLPARCFCCVAGRARVEIPPTGAVKRVE